MSVDYSKAEERFFLLFGTEGSWQEVGRPAYVAAKTSTGGDSSVQDFKTPNMRGTVTTDGSRPKDVKETVKPTVAATSSHSESSIRMVFPEGACTIASIDATPGEVVLILSREQYKNLTRAQLPLSLETISAQADAQAEKGGPIKGVVFGAVAEVLRDVAKDMASGTPAKKPSLQDLRDLLRR